MTENSGLSDEGVTEPNQGNEPLAHRDNSAQLDAGWHPDPEGALRYWDGSSWLDIPAPADATQVVASKSPKKRNWTLILIAGVVLIGAGIVAAALMLPGAKGINAAYSACVSSHGSDAKMYLVTADGNQAIGVVEGAGKNYARSCVFEALEAPQSLIAEQSGTAFMAPAQGALPGNSFDTQYFGSFGVTWGQTPGGEDLLIFYDVAPEQADILEVPDIVGAVVETHLRDVYPESELPQGCGLHTNTLLSSPASYLSTVLCDESSQEINSDIYWDIALEVCRPDTPERLQYFPTAVDQIKDRGVPSMLITGVYGADSLSRMLSVHPEVVATDRNSLEVNSNLAYEVVYVTRTMNITDIHDNEYLSIYCVESGEDFVYSKYDVDQFAGSLNARQDQPPTNGTVEDEFADEYEPEFVDEYEDDIIQPGEIGCNAGASACGFENGISFSELRAEIHYELSMFYGQDIGEVTCNHDTYPPNRTPVGEFIRCDFTNGFPGADHVMVEVTDQYPFYEWGTDIFH